MFLLKHLDKVACADLSHDGRFAVTSDRSRNILAWKLDAPEAPVRTIALGGKSSDVPVAISPDGSQIAYALTSSPFTTKPQTEKVAIASVDTGETLRTIDIPGNPTALRWFEDGTLAVGTERKGLHLVAPDASEPELVGTKTLSVRFVAGTSLQPAIVDRAFGGLKLFGPPPKRKADALKVKCGDWNGSVVVFGEYGKAQVTRREGKTVTTVQTPSSPEAVAIAGDRIFVVCKEALLVFALADLSLVRRVDDNFTGVGFARVAAERVILWGLPQLDSSLSAAFLVELGEGAREAPAAHGAPITDLQWLDDSLISRDERGLALRWRPGAQQPEALAASGPSLPPLWRVRAGVDKVADAVVNDAAPHGDGLVVAHPKGGVRFVNAAGTASRVRSKFDDLGALGPGALTPLGPAMTAVTGFNSAVVLHGVPPRSAHVFLANRVVAESGGQFLVSLSNGIVSVRPTGWPASELASKGVGAVDIGLTEHDGLVVLGNDGLRLIDLGTWQELSMTALAKPATKIAVRSTAEGTEVGVAFKDGTVERHTLPAIASTTRVADRIATRAARPLAGVVLSELRRVLQRQGDAPEVLELPPGPYKLPSFLRELFAWRSVLPLNGNSPDVWADLPQVESFFKHLWKITKTPKPEQTIDLGAIHFPGIPQLAAHANDFRTVPLVLATVEGSSIRWLVSEGIDDAASVDPFVTFEDTRTGEYELIGRLSELLYRLAPGSPPDLR